ncbi:MAG: hypothetical protein COA78_29710 [Blastopirellula sp.]|nr:MAG: hypothetical protein COA78_29710 [Blastopirellula sp.]
METQSSYRDQATLLRMLAHKAVVPAMESSPAAPMAVLLGAKPEIGTTTLCLNIATSMATQGKRVVVLDLDIHSTGMAQATGKQAQISISDLIQQKHDLHEVLIAGPAGTLILPTKTESAAEFTFGHQTLVRFGQQLKNLGKHADVLLIDAGNEITIVDHFLWGMAEQFVLVSSAHKEAITQGYAKIKQLNQDRARPDICTIVSRCSSANDGDLVNHGLTNSCRKFLKLPVQPLGVLNFSLEVNAANLAAQPYVLRYPHASITKQTSEIAGLLLQGLPHNENLMYQGAA